MGIFAGAPVRRPSPDSWIVLPKASRVPVSVGAGRPTAVNPRTQVLREQRAQNRLSRNVDAVIDIANHPGGLPGEGGDTGDDDDGETGEENDDVGPLLRRTLRRRGLSDSSIHSTFVEGERERASNVDDVPPQELGRGSMLRSLSRRVQNLRFMGTPAPTSSSSSSTLDVSRDAASIHSQQSTGKSGAGGTGLVDTLLPNLATWGGGTSIETMAEPFVVGSPNESSFFERARRTQHGYTVKDFY